jgi:hypothetical protein
VRRALADFITVPAQARLEIGELTVYLERALLDWEEVMAAGTINKLDMSARKDPAVVTVHRGFDGALHHSRCSRDLRYLGARGGGRELDFYCQTCHEHVTLPQIVVSRLLTADPAPRHPRRREVPVELVTS